VNLVKHLPYYFAVHVTVARSNETGSISI